MSTQNDKAVARPLSKLLENNLKQFTQASPCNEHTLTAKLWEWEQLVAENTALSNADKIIEGLFSVIESRVRNAEISSWKEKLQAGRDFLTKIASLRSNQP